MTIAHGNTLVSADPVFHYTAYGLNIESEIQIQELPVGSGLADLKITRGAVPQSLECPRHSGDIIHTTSNQTLLLLKSKVGADFLISSGQEILVDFDNASQLPGIRLAILGYCLTTIFFQRKFLVFHGNALLTPQGAIAICGQQQAGKSTTTMGLYKRGYSVIADDLTAVSMNSYPELRPGFPRLKLWADTLARFSESSEGLMRILPETEKYSFPVEQGFHKQTEVLNTVYILKKAEINIVTTRHLVGVEKLLELSKQIRSYAPDQLPHGSLWVLEACSQLADKINVVEIERPIKRDSIDQVIDLIEIDGDLRDSRKLVS